MKIQGLNKEQVASRKKDGLVNNVDTNISKTKKQIIIEHTLTYFNGLNLLLALLIVFSGKIMNMAFIGVVVINTLMGIIQEFKVKKTIDQLAIFNAETCRVLREEEEEIPLHEIVMDDLLLLEEGSQIPVDAEVVDTGFLEVNEALLTGEQKPIQKHNGDQLLGGSFVASGSCYARVCHVGHDNYATQLIIKAKHAHRAASQMRDTIEKIIKIISIVIIPVGLILFRSQYYAYHGDLPMAIVKTVGGLVGMIPEGLVLLTSLSFVLGVGRLAAKNALVQQMEAIEALARVDVLCLDKTGTITTGELEVANVDYYSPSQEEVDRAIGAFVHLSSNHNMTQTCLKRYFEKPEGYQAGAEIPFSSARKYQAMTMNDAHYYLGAADLMVDESLSGKVNDYAAQGYRVLAFCQGDHLTLDFNELSSCELLAVIIIRDVIKEDAVKTFDYLQKAGVQIVVLSGDNPLTVSRVCKKAEIHGADRYYNANQLPDDEQELAQLVEEIRVFGRVKPEQKQAIIKALQSHDHIVGMVGDGVNDVLAIKDADCGIAMANGADAPKQAAHIILMDSNFSSMIDIIEEGRTIIANIEKVSSLYLTKTIYSSLLSLIFGFMLMPYPFIPLQLTLLGGFAIGIPSFVITLQDHVKPKESGFIPHIMHTALPAGLTIVLMIVIMTFLKGSLPFQNYYSSYSYYLTCFISFIVLYLVLKPLKRKDVILLTGMVVFYIIAVEILHPMINVVSLLSGHMIYLIPMLMISYGCIQLMSHAFDSIFMKG